MTVCYRDLGRHGRLGNALFQLAATAGIADRMGTVPRFNADWMHRPYFSVPDEFFTDDFTGCVDAAATPAVEHIDPRARTYLQDLALFERIMPMLREWFGPSPLAEAQIEECSAFHELPGPILSVHARRGDKVPGQDPGTPDIHRYFVLPSLAYYRAGINRYGPWAASVVTFGDDPAWNAANLSADYHHVGLPRPKEQEPDFLTAPVLDHVDLFLQARCERHVLSGSTFGIWAALLAGDDQAIYPFPVYGPKLAYIDETLLYPKSWCRLSADRGLPC